MIRIFGIALFTLTILAYASPLRAEPEITSADRSEINARIAELGDVVRTSNFAGIVDIIPPRLLQTIAAQNRVDADTIKEAIPELMKAAMGDVEIISFNMDVSTALTGTTPDGNRTYLLVPTETVVAIPNRGRIRSTSQTLVLKDDGRWYLIRIDNANQVMLVQATYPEFTGVEFEAETIAVVD